MDSQVWDIKVWDIIEIDLSTYNHYKWRAKVLWVLSNHNIYPLKIEYLDSFLAEGVSQLLWKKSWIKLCEVVSIERLEEKKLLEKDFKFIKL